MSDLLNDPMFFYSVAFVIFLAAAYHYGRKPILNWLDAEIKKISDELTQAQKLRAEAEATLQDYKKKQAEATQQAEEIIKHAQAEAVRLRSNADADLKTWIAQQEQQALDRIRSVEMEALAAVRNAAIDMAISEAEKTFLSQLNQNTASLLIDHALDEIPNINAAKAKAA